MYNLINCILQNLFQVIKTKNLKNLKVKRTRDKYDDLEIQNHVHILTKSYQNPTKSCRLSQNHHKSFKISQSYKFIFNINLVRIIF